MNNVSNQRLRRLRRLSVVPRWVVLPTLRRQSVAEHSFHVAHIALWLAARHRDLCNGGMDGAILFYALIHDETEAITGDIPSPAGKKDGAVPGKSAAYEKLNGHGDHDAPEEIKKILKLADILEAYWFICEEEHMGSNILAAVKQEIVERLTPLLIEFPAVKGHWTETFSEFHLAITPSMHPVLEKPDEN